jgi:broad specificity phosphatase PhoE
MILYVVRHGQTEHNRGGLGLGREDVPLTALGEAQAEAVGRRFASLDVRRVYSSPLGRAAAVARAIAAPKGLPVVATEDLIELDVGEAEGMTGPEMREQFPDFFPRWLGPNPESVPMPGGESLADVGGRVDQFLAMLRESDDEAVAAVTHNFVVKVMLCRLLELPIASFRDFAIDLGSISTFMIRSERVNVLSVNDTCHLISLES